MIATALIVFREVFELALVVGIVLASTQEVGGKGKWVGLGIAAGTLGACVIAAFAGVIANLAGGMGQELLNATILLAAVAMLGWHNVWMSRHAREMARRMDAVGRAVAAGARPPYALAVVVGMAALREGSEIVLFLWGIAASEGSGQLGMLAGGGLGLAGGLLIGLGMYLGLLRIPQRYIFAVTSWMILLLAAGMASQAAGFMVQAGWVPPLGDPVWDSSWLLRDKSAFARVLHTLVGYTARPAGMQLVFYAIALATIGGLMRLLGPERPRQAAKMAAVAIALGIPLAGTAPRAEASDFKVFHPIVVQGETELELRGIDRHFNAGDVPDERNRTIEAGYGFTDWWFAELEAEYVQGGDQEQPGFQHTAKAIENVFAPIPQGTYWVDLGAFLEAEFAAQPDTPNEVFFGPLFETQFGHWLHTLNVIWHGEYGTNADPNIDLRYAWQTKWLLHLHFQPGLEIHGNAGDWTRFAPRSEQTAYAGPVVFGMWIFGRGYNLRYELGQLYGMTEASADTVTKFMLEFEHVF